MRRHFFAFGLVCLVAVLAVGSLAALEAYQKDQPPKETVKVAKPIVRDIVDYEEFVGRVEPTARVEMRPRVTGYVEKALVEAGAMVKRDEVLFGIDGRVYKAQYDADRANLLVQEASFNYARATNERFKSVAKNAPGSISQAEL